MSTVAVTRFYDSTIGKKAVMAVTGLILFGFLIATISSYLGYFTQGGTAGVGQASTRSVVFSSILVILMNVVVVKAIFFFFPGAAQ